jgi:uncharacterized protein DUF5682
MLHLLGIRHHGPGSTRSMLRALDALRPDCLLVEAPADAEDMLRLIAIPASPQSGSSQSTVPGADCGLLTPPVAILIYNPKDISQASYLPFAEFSPEWQAVKFALQNNIPVRCMDLPMGLHFALDEMEKSNSQAAIDFIQKLTTEEQQFRHDPMAHIARLAGYTDSERWWEVTFESAENETAIFTAILEMTTALREAAGEETARTLQREAHMRQCIRKAEKEGFQNIAVVCGAWHVSALHEHKRFKASHDAALLKGSPPLRRVRRVKTTATWIPWSYDRLTFQSGYQSGVISPAWYDLLFKNPKEAATRWMINVARLFRKEDLDASSAHVIEAIRLSETLSAMRGLALPGIEELKEAAIATICEGGNEKLELIEQKLITGEAVGTVPPHLKIPTVPLLRDIEQTVKSARLRKYWENTAEECLGATTSTPRGGIDLREETGRRKSHLLHRLGILGIPWGRRIELDRHQSAGGFKEFWKLKWSPDFTIRIIEMGAWGNTLEDACIRFLKKRAEEIETLPALTALVSQTLEAHLPEAMNTLLRKLESLAALTREVFDLMDALPPLARVVRYGDTRGSDVAAVTAVVRHIVPRVCIGLPGAVAHLDEEASKAAFDRLLGVHRSLNLLNLPDYNEPWHTTLESIAGSATANGLLTGACTRILFDKNIFTPEETATRMRYALSPANAPLAAAQWLEGFLQGSGLLLLHNHALWNLIDGWIDELGEDTFNDVLPMLRRTFARFPQPERERMLDSAKAGQMAVAKTASGDFDEERAGMVVGVVRRLLGI